jgi:hypothetical protein
VQYATNSLPYLLKHTPDDEHLRDTLLALNDWMATHRQPGGGWGYPHYLTAKMSWNYEYCRGIMHAMMIEPRQIYLDAIRENIASIVQLYEIYGEVAAGLNPWEFAAGINQPQRQEMYELASDRDVMRDYEEGAVNFGAVYSRGPDHPVYFTVLLRDYLQLASEDSLSESWEILDRIKQLPTNRDPEIVLPESLELAPHASFTLGVSYNLDDPASAKVYLTDLPENVTAEPEELTWTAERGFGRSPAFRVSGTPRGEGKMTVHWQMGPWEGQRDVRLLPAEAP